VTRVAARREDGNNWQAAGHVSRQGAACDLFRLQQPITREVEQRQRRIDVALVEAKGLERKRTFLPAEDAVVVAIMQAHEVRHDVLSCCAKLFAVHSPARQHANACFKSQYTTLAGRSRDKVMGGKPSK